MIQVKFILVDDNAIEPARATDGAAGYDLVAIEKHEIVPHGHALVDTGIALEIPEGYCGWIVPRSGLALKKGLTVLNAPGLIDSDYRGNVKVLLWNSNDEGKTQTVAAGDRIAQLVFAKIETVALERAAWLRSSSRGAGGFGSTDELPDQSEEEADELRDRAAALNELADNCENATEYHRLRGLASELEDQADEVEAEAPPPPEAA
jgi:dUTP pyrophosphatase